MPESLQILTFLVIVPGSLLIGLSALKLAIFGRPLPFGGLGDNAKAVPENPLLSWPLTLISFAVLIDCLFSIGIFKPVEAAIFWTCVVNFVGTTWDFMKRMSYSQDSKDNIARSFFSFGSNAIFPQFVSPLFAFANYLLIGIIISISLTQFSISAMIMAFICSFAVLLVRGSGLSLLVIGVAGLFSLVSLLLGFGLGGYYFLSAGFYAVLALLEYISTYFNNQGFLALYNNPSQSS